MDDDDQEFSFLGKVALICSVTLLVIVISLAVLSSMARESLIGG